VSPSTRYTLLSIVVVCILTAGAFLIWLVAGDANATEVRLSELFRDPERFDGQRISLTAYFDGDSCSFVYPPSAEHPIQVDLPKWPFKFFVHGSGFFRAHGTLRINRTTCTPCDLPHTARLTEVTRLYPDPLSHARLSFRRSNQAMQPTASPRTARAYADH